MLKIFKVLLNVIYYNIKLELNCTNIKKKNRLKSAACWPSLFCNYFNKYDSFLPYSLGLAPSTYVHHFNRNRFIVTCPSRAHAPRTSLNAPLALILSALASKSSWTLTSLSQPHGADRLTYENDQRPIDGLAIVIVINKLLFHDRTAYATSTIVINNNNNLLYSRGALCFDGLCFWLTCVSFGLDVTKKLCQRSWAERITNRTRTVG